MWWFLQYQGLSLLVKTIEWFQALVVLPRSASHYQISAEVRFLRRVATGVRSTTRCRKMPRGSVHYSCALLQDILAMEAVLSNVGVWTASCRHQHRKQKCRTLLKWSQRKMANASVIAFYEKKYCIEEWMRRRGIYKYAYDLLYPVHN